MLTTLSYASSSFVWSDWSNQTGYTSNGFVFLGMFYFYLAKLISHQSYLPPSNFTYY
jgi:hypothetical protein